MKKVVVITGGNSGLGKATAKVLSKTHKVVILGRNIKEVVKTAKELKCEGVICDVTDARQVKDSFVKIIKKYKKVDCLINCAGVWMKGAVDKNTPEEMQSTIAVNVLGTMYTVNSLVPHLKKQKSGRIINVSSRAGLSARADRSVYNTSKWAVTGFTKCIQLELAPFNISVVGFYPGLIKTGIFGKAKYKPDLSKAMEVEQPAQALAYLVDVDANLVIKGFEIESIKSI